MHVACCFVGFDYSHIQIIYICILPYICSRDVTTFWERSNWFPLEICFKFTQNAFITVKHVCLCQNRDSNRNRKKNARNRDRFFLSTSHSPR